MIEDGIEALTRSLELVRTLVQTLEHKDKLITALQLALKGSLEMFDAYLQMEFPEGPDVHETKPGKRGEVLAKDVADGWRWVKQEIVTA